MKKKNLYLPVFLAALLILVLALPKNTFASDGTEGDTNTTPFTDIQEGSFYYEPVLWAYQANPKVTTGTDETHFMPKYNATRGMALTMLWRSFGCPEPTITECPFTDVKEGKYYYKAALWAAEKGITKGLLQNPERLCVSDSVTRCMFITYLYRAYGSPEVDLPPEYDGPFVDNDTEESFYYIPVLWATENGITIGTDRTHFSPGEFCTRGQVVTFLYRCRKN